MKVQEWSLLFLALFFQVSCKDAKKLTVLMSVDSQNELITVIHRHTKTGTTQTDTIFHDSLRVNYITGLSGLVEFYPDRYSSLEVYSNNLLLLRTEPIRGRDVYVDLQIIDSNRRITLLFPKKGRMRFY